ncbi:MAG: T9SS type A sorting domain-containing protein [Ferruginibacter sp.]|nr:T9SS type A sorting domain-containing protein [Ferruginibacter sp.]
MKKPSISLILLSMAFLVSFNGFSLPVLNSLPAASATIYLDFDGHNVNSAYWKGGTPFSCESSGMTDIQITEVFKRVAEDYRPFDINITTDESKFLAAPLSKRIRIVITPTSGWFTGVGGVSFIGSFKWGDDTPAFVFSDRLGPNSPKMVAECCSHESGHAVGLSHQSKYDGTCNLTATYNEGEGTGVNAWAPIMGNSYYRNMSGWNDGPTPYGCTNIQDNLSIITSQNGFTYRTDDYSNDINNTPAVFAISGADIAGVISTNTDKDAFNFTISQNSILHINIRPYSIDASYQGANLDVKMSLYNSARELVRTFDPADAMDVVVDTVLSTGSYYMLVDGAGNRNVNDYGSLGSYAISSSGGGILPIRNASLKGRVEKSKHTLSWNILSDEPVKLISVESSTDGTQFITVNTITDASNNFTYTPAQNADLFYRIKVTSSFNQTVYSNTIRLKGIDDTRKIFTVSTFIQNEISVNADENYQYRLTDVKGNSIARGNGQAGYNKVDMGMQPRGMYIMQIFCNKQQQTERIIKQ